MIKTVNHLASKLDIVFVKRKTASAVVSTSL